MNYGVSIPLGILALVLVSIISTAIGNTIGESNVKGKIESSFADFSSTSISQEDKEKIYEESILLVCEDRDSNGNEHCTDEYSISKINDEYNKSLIEKFNTLEKIGENEEYNGKLYLSLKETAGMMKGSDFTNYTNKALIYKLENGK